MCVGGGGRYKLLSVYCECVYAYAREKAAKTNSMSCLGVAA